MDTGCHFWLRRAAMDDLPVVPTVRSAGFQGREGNSRRVRQQHGQKKEADDGEEVEREIRFLKIYTVFNAEQIRGLPTEYYAAPKTRFESEPERLANAESFIAATGAEVREGGAVACYFPKLDRIAIPPLPSFKSREAFYGTVLHEITHYSGHKTRLDRDLTGGRGSIKYAREELVAELGAAFLCADLEITPETRADHAAYLDHWLTVMKEDNRAIFKAAAHAQRAADFLHNLSGGEYKPESHG